MLLFLGITLLVGSLLDLIFNGFKFLQIIIALVGLSLAIWSLIIPFLKKKIANSKLSFASGFLARIVLLAALAALCLFTLLFWPSPAVYTEQQLTEARFQAETGDYSQAYDRLQALADKYPAQAWAAKKEKAFLLLAQTRLEEASNLFNEIIYAQPHDLQARFGRVQLLLAKKDWTNARKESQTLLLYDPHFFQAYIALGDISSQEGDLLRTIHYYQLASRENPAVAEVHYKLGTAYRQALSYSDALYEYKNALSLAATESEKNDISASLRELSKEIDQM